MGLLDSDTILGSADGPAFVDLAGLGDSRAGDPAWPDSLLPDDPLRRRFYGAILGIDPQPGRRGADDAAAGGLNASPAAPAGAAAWRAATPRPPAAAAPAETMPRGDDDELTAHHGALERAVMDSARQDGHLAADELQKIYGPGATGEFRFASRAPAATSPPPELQPWAQRQPATNEGRGTGPSDSQDLAAQAQPAFTAPTGPVAPDATSADDLAFHQAVLRHALRSVGAPPEYMEPRDITGAARLMAEQGLAPADAFARATVRDALEQSHFAPADIDKIYSPGVAGAIAGNPLQSATANLGGFRPSQDNEPPIAGEKIDSADMQASWPDGGTAASLNLERQQNFARADRPSAPTDISSARRGPQRGGPLLPEPTVFQRQALSNALSRLQRAMQEIRKLHPRWRPQTSSLLAPDSNQGVIDHAQERAREAENHLADLRRRSIGGNYGPPLQAKPRVPAPWSASGWIKAYRAANSRPDLFGHPTRVTDKDTVAFTMLDGMPIFGVNSNMPLYTGFDAAAANAMRTTLLTKYGDLLSTENIGWMPNNAIYHAEATLLLRAARENSGTLEGQILEVHVDRITCPSCPTVLPLIGRELGNPTVIFVDNRGKIVVMHDGKWMR